MKNQARIALALSVVALVAALSGVGGVLAAQQLITGKQIKNNSLTSADLKNNNVASSDLRNGTVSSADLGANSVGAEELMPNSVGSEEIDPGAVHTSDIGANQVDPANLELPAPVQMVEAESSPATVPTSFTLTDPVGIYAKSDPSSALEVSWTGSASAGFTPCQFQIRVDGQPASAGAGVVYVANGSTLSVSATALFTGLSAGPHEVQVWARTTTGDASACTVGPTDAGINQTFVVSEVVV